MEKSARVRQPRGSRSSLAKAGFVGVIAFLVACAKVAMPPGVPYELEPLKLLSTSPSNMECNVPTEKTIEFRFNRAIRISKDEIFISPRVGGFKVNLKGKNLVIIPSKLEKEKTYLITLGPSLSDRFGKTIEKPVQILFSTGEYIDTVSISGYVIDNNLMFKEGVIVGLFRNKLGEGSDSLIPFHFTVTGKNGFFNLAGIEEHDRSFTVVAFEDVNKSLTLELKNEPTGFLSNAKADTYIVFISEPETNKVKEIKATNNGAYQINLSQSLVWVSVREKNEGLMAYISPEREDIINLVLLPGYVQGLTSIISIDGIGGKNFKKSRFFVELNEGLPQDSISPRIYSVLPYYTRYGIGIELVLSEPVTGLQIGISGNREEPYMITRKFELDPIRAIFYISPSVQPGDTLTITALGGKDFAGNQIVNESKQLIIPSQEQLGSLRIYLESSTLENLWAYMVSENYSFAFPVDTTTIYFKHFPTGTYRVITFLDRDSSRTYTALDQDSQPETILTLPKVISVRNNWITEVSFSIKRKDKHE